MANLRNLIRIANTDIDGNKQVLIALQNIKGVGIMFSNAICTTLKLKKNLKSGELSQEDIKRIEELLTDPAKFAIPTWMFNRRNDPESGEDKHLSTTDVRFITEEDIKQMKKIKSYRGLRHQWNLPVRGQRTKSNFRRNKGKATGVKKKKAVA